MAEISRTSDVETVLARIALLQRNILDPSTGMAVVAYDNAPYSISAASMPLFVTFVHPLVRNDLMGSDNFGREFNDTRTYDMILYLSPFGTGIEGENLGLLTQWFDAVHSEFGKWPKLKALAGIQSALITADSGASVQEYNGQRYYGIRFTLSVTRRARWLLGEND